MRMRRVKTERETQKSSSQKQMYVDDDRQN